MRALGRATNLSVVAAEMLLALLLVVLLTACGSETDSSGRDPGRDDDDGGSEVLDAEVVAILSGTASGGVADPQRVVRLDVQGGVERLIAGLRRQLPADVRRVVGETDVPKGRALLGAVVTIGCDVPSGLAVSGSDPVVLTPTWEGVTRLQECFAPVTSVGIVLVDEELAAGAE